MSFIKRVCCLYRVSTEKQVEKNDIPMQRTACQEFTEQKGWKIVESNIATVNDEVISLKAELEAATAGQIEAQATINDLEKQLADIEEQSPFEAEFWEELTYIAKDTSMTVENRKSLINEIGDMSKCNVDKYIDMITNDGGGTGTGTGSGDTTTTTPPATTPPTTTPPPKTTTTPEADTGGNTGGTDTEGMTKEEMEDAMGGRMPGRGSGSTSHPDDKLG